ncbi:hypothetical protein ACHAXH_001603, partial [Discostella pseudostelligera]
PASSSSSLSPSSLSSPSAQHFDVEVESNSAGTRDNNKVAAAGGATTKSSRGGVGVGAGDLIYVSPSKVRFQHSRIRPQFSGCGRSVLETLEQIRQGKLEPGDLPPIQVIIGTDDTDDGGEPWYFSLNNRRLWVLKQCHREGLLDNERYNNKIGVRARAARSQAESLRYTVDNCALEAKFMREDSGKNGSKQKKRGKGKKKVVTDVSESNVNESNNFSHSRSERIDDGCNKIEGACTNKDDCIDESESDDDVDDDDDFVSCTNPFSALS